MKVITIGRECGSGGHSIALKLAEELHIPCYDKEIIAIVAEKVQVSHDYVEQAGELIQNGLFSNLYSFSEHIYPYAIPSLQDQINQAQVDLIRQLADKGPCVIVGRGADYILREYKDVLNVFIKAPMEYKIHQSKIKHNLSEKEAKDILKKRDKDRSKHYYFYTGQTWGDPKHYDMVLDSSVLGENGCVKVIAEAYKNC